MASTAEYHYYAFNVPPNKPISIKNHNHYFAQPIQLFPPGATGRKYALRWMREENERRNAKRKYTGLGLSLDNLFGEFIDVEIRRQLVIKLDYEVVKEDVQPQLEEVINGNS